MDDLPNIDYTGSGYSGTGNAPSWEQRRRNAEQRFRTGRVADAMQYIDPYAIEAGAKISQMVTGTKDPGATRRQLFSSAPGQLIMDGAMLARHAGIIGQGDPYRYAHNITAGVTGGGFTGNVYDGDNRRVGFDQAVTGNGALAEQVSMNYAKGMMQKLYGEGTPDPEKLHGFDMTEASGVFRTIARRGGLGNVMTYKQNATMDEKLEAARRSALDPIVRAGLEGVTEKNMDSKLKQEGLDGKVKEALENVKKTTGANVLDDSAQDKIADTVREVTKGMAALSDIYGELSAPALQMQLESLTGKKIVDAKQAKRAAAMVDSMTGAAEAAGIDPRTFLDLVQNAQGDMRGAVAQSLGLDERSNPAIKEAAANMANRNSMESVVGSKLSQQTEKGWRDAGMGEFEGTSQDLQTMMADTSQGQKVFMDQFKGTIAMRGMQQVMSEDDKAEAAQIEKERAATTDPKDLQLLEQRARALVGKNAKDGTFESFSKSHTGAVAMGRGTTGENADVNQEEMRRFRLAHTDTQGVANNLVSDNGMQREDAVGMAKTLVENLGSAGMQRVMKIADDEGLNAEDKNKAMDEFMGGTAGMDQATIDKFKGTFLDEKGGLKDKKAFTKTALKAKFADWGENSVTDANMRTQEQLNQLSDTSGRAKMSDEKGGLSIKGIAKALLEKKVRAIDTPENISMAMQAMKDEGMELKSGGESLNDQYQNNIDLSKGFDEKSLGQFDKVAGKELGLAKAMGFDNQEDFIKASKTDNKLMLRAVTHLKETEGMSVGGGLGSMSAISDKAQKAFREQKVDQRFKDLSVARSLFPTMKEGDQNNLTQSILQGDKADIGHLFDADKKESLMSTEKGDKRKFAHLGKVGRLMDVADQIGGADEDAMKSFSKFNEDGNLQANLEKEAKTMRDLQKKGATTWVTKDEKGKVRGGEITTSLAAINAAIEKLKTAQNATTQTVGVMKVTTLQVENQQHKK